MRKFKIANGLVTGVALCLLLFAGACSLGDDAVEDAGAPSDVVPIATGRCTLGEAFASLRWGWHGDEGSPACSLQEGRGRLVDAAVHRSGNGPSNGS